MSTTGRRSGGAASTSAAARRAIAEDARVDPALVLHFFGSKQKLFLTVMTLPFEPEEVMPEILAGPRSQIGMRLARFAVGVLEDPQGGDVMTGITRSARRSPRRLALSAT